MFIRKTSLDTGGSSSTTSLQCNEVARFPDPINNHYNCYRSYVLCIANDNWRSYSCPLGTRFSEFEDRCISDPETEAECLTSGDKHEMTEMVSDRITTIFDCPSAGVFRNEFSVTCEDYILCVNTIQADIYAIYLHCKDHQFFSQEHAACIEKDKNYCDENGQLHLINHPPTRPLIAATPGALAQTITPTTEISWTTPVITTTTISTPIEMSLEIAEYKTETTTPTTSTEEDSKDNDDDDSVEVEIIAPIPVAVSFSEPIPSYLFKCPEAGRFKSPFGDDARYYILCIARYYSNELNGYRFQCPVATVFSPERKRCVREYFNLVEEETDAMSTEETTELYTTTTKPGIVTDGTTLSTRDLIQSTDSPITSTNVLIISTTELPITTTVIPDTTTDPVKTTESVTKTKTQTEFKQFQCKERGRFHSEYTLDCRSYLLCTENADGEFIGTYFNCPKDTKFSDILGRCVKDYDCPYYYCDKPGVYPYVRDKDRYVLCLRRENRVIGYRMKCPKETVFSNIRRRCISKKFKELMVW